MTFQNNGNISLEFRKKKKIRNKNRILYDIKYINSPKIFQVLEQNTTERKKESLKQ